MSVYSGTAAPPTGLSLHPVCFTGSDATSIKFALGVAAAVGGAIAGLGLGWLVSWLWPEIVTKAVALIVGAIGGGIIGLGYALVAFRGGACPCPPGAQAVCICFIVFIIPGTTTEIPVPPFLAPSCAACRLVPPGCP